MSGAPDAAVSLWEEPSTFAVVLEQAAADAPGGPRPAPAPGEPGT